MFSYAAAARPMPPRMQLTIIKVKKNELMNALRALFFLFFINFSVSRLLSEQLRQSIPEQLRRIAHLLNTVDLCSDFYKH